MARVVELQSLFAAKKTTPSIDAHSGAGIILQARQMAFLYKGVERLDFTMLHVRLQVHLSQTHAGAVIEGHYPDMEGRVVSGNFYQDRNAYESLLKHEGGNPRPAYIHALMLEHRGLYFRPESLNIEGYGQNLWFSGLIPLQKGLKPTETSQPQI